MRMFSLLLGVVAVAVCQCAGLPPSRPVSSADTGISSMRIDQATPFSSLAVAGISTLIGGASWNLSRGDSVFTSSDGANRTILLYRRLYNTTLASTSATSPPIARVEVRITTTTYDDFPGGLEWTHRLQRAGAAPPPPSPPSPDTARECSVCRGPGISVDSVSSVARWPTATKWGTPGCDQAILLQEVPHRGGDSMPSFSVIVDAKPIPGGAPLYVDVGLCEASIDPTGEKPGTGGWIGDSGKAWVFRASGLYRDPTMGQSQGSNFSVPWGCLNSKCGPTNVTVQQLNATSLELLVDGVSQGVAVSSKQLPIASVVPCVSMCADGGQISFAGDVHPRENPPSVRSKEHLSELRELDTLFPVPADAVVTLHRQMGSSARRTDYRPVSDSLIAGGAPLLFGSATHAQGRPSDGDFPSFVIATRSGGSAFMIGWSGSWIANISRTASGVRVSVGTGRLSAVLHAGEDIRAGRLLALPYDGGDYRVGYNTLRRYLRAHIVPRRADGNLSGWFLSGNGFDGWPVKTGVSQRWHIDQLKKAGADTFWCDAEWFKGGFPSGAGNWHLPLKETEDRVDFPEGIAALMDYARAPQPGPGLSTILWNEVERVAKGSYISQTFPEWIAPFAGGGHGTLLDLGNPDARLFIQEFLVKEVEAYGLTVLRFDFNVDPLRGQTGGGGGWQELDVRAQTAAGGLPRTGVSEARYVEGLYTMWDAVLAAHPGLLIDTCASGGRRIDLEILQRAVALWFTDYSFHVPANHCPEPEVDSLMSQNDWSGQQALFMGAYLTMPLTSVGTHIFHYEPYRFRSGGPAARTIDFGQSAWQGIVANTSKFALLQAAIQEQNLLRSYVEADNDFWPLTPITPNETEWAAYQVMRRQTGPTTTDGFAVFFRRCRAESDTLTVPLMGLDRTKSYLLQYRHGYAVDKTETVSGASLAAGFRVVLTSPSSSVLILLTPSVAVVPVGDHNIFTPAVAGVLDAEALEAFVLARSAAGATRLSIAKPAGGSYTVAGPDQPGGYAACGAHICLGHSTVGITGVELDMGGVTVVLGQRNRTAVQVNNAVNFSLTGLRTQYAEFPTNQATITNVASDDRSVTVTVPTGYPTEDWASAGAAGLSCNVFSSKSWLWKPGTYDLHFSSNVSSSDPRQFLLSITNLAAHQSSNAVVGDMLGCRPLQAEFCFAVRNTSSSAFRDIILRGGTSFGFFESGTQMQNLFDGVEIRRPPRPAGATVEPLLSMAADGFHSNGNRVGPQIINSHLERMADDGIAIHGAYALVVAHDPTNRTSLIVQTQGVYIPIAGDTIRLYDKAFLPTVSDFVVARVSLMSPQWRPKHNTSQSLPLNGFQYDGPYMALTFTAALPRSVGFDWVANNADLNGNGFELRNNTIANHRARGMLIKASNGVIHGNTINGSTLGGIIVTPELSWGEADFVRNLTITSNSILNVGYAKVSYGAIALGATAFVSHQRVFDSGYGHRSVVIANNSVSDIDTWGLWISSSNGVTLRGNRFERVWQRPSWADPWSPFPVPLNTVVFMTDATAIEAEDNCIVDVGRYATTLVKVTSTANVSSGSQSIASWDACS